MEQITLSDEQLMKQATMTANDYMLAAVRSVDDRFGEGYAVKHPETLGAMLNVAARDFATAQFLKTTGELWEYILSFSFQFQRLNDMLHEMAHKSDEPATAE